MNGVGCGSPVETFHNRMLLSSEPEASRLESGDQAMVFIPARWPSSVCSRLPVMESQILTVQSALHEAIQRPSGENLTDETPFLWPRRMRVGL
jgi:hypothetical protein